MRSAMVLRRHNDAAFPALVKGLALKGVSLAKRTPGKAIVVFRKIRELLLRLKEKVKDHPFLTSMCITAISLAASSIVILYRNKLVDEVGIATMEFSFEPRGSKDEKAYLSNKYPDFRQILVKRQWGKTLDPEDFAKLDKIRAYEFESLKRQTRKLVDVVNSIYHKNRYNSETETITLDRMFERRSLAKRRIDAQTKAILQKEAGLIQEAANDAKKIKEEALVGKAPTKGSVRAFVTRFKEAIRLHAKTNRDKLFKQNVRNTIMTAISVAGSVAGILLLRKLIRQTRDARDLEGLYRDFTSYDDDGTIGEAFASFRKRKDPTPEDRERLLKTVTEVVKSRMKEMDTVFLNLQHEFDYAKKTVSEAYRAAEKRSAFENFSGTTIDV